MKARLYPQPFPHLFCDVFLCNTESKWLVGEEDGPQGAVYRLCDSCAKAMIANVPEALLPEDMKSRMWQETPAPDRSRVSAIIADIAEEDDTEPVVIRTRSPKKK